MSGELNLLPPPRRRLLTRQLLGSSLTRFGQHVVTGLLLLTLAGVAAIAVLSALAWTTARSTQAEFDQDLKRYQELRDVIAQQNVSLQAMTALSDQRITWSQLLPSFLATVPPGVQIKTISGQTSNQILSFSGVAAARSTLVVLTERLKSLAWVKEVKAPLTNLLQRENPSFQVDLILKAPEAPIP